MRLCRTSCDGILRRVVLRSGNRKFSSSSPSPNRPITHLVFGANTDIGKTVLAAALIRAASAGPTETNATHYIKPLQCGGSDESFVRKHAGDSLSSATTLFEWETPVSPHVAARLENKPVSDEQVLDALADRLDELDSAATNTTTSSSSSSSSIWIETAGGVLSPSSSSPENDLSSHHSPRNKNETENGGWLPQANLYGFVRDRSSVVLIGDGRLGGISSTLTALEALLNRKYTVGGILMIRGDDDSGNDSNLEALREYAATYGKDAAYCTSGVFEHPETGILSLPPLPPEPEPLDEWFASSDVQDPLSRFVHGHLFPHYGRYRF